MGFCERCKQHQATVHVTNIAPMTGEKAERHLCDQCAVEEGYAPAQKPILSTELLEQFVKSAKSVPPVANLVCEECGLGYLEFRNHGLLGCPHDYDQFKEVLAPLIERAQDGAGHHVGKSPRHLGRPRVTEQDVRVLRRQLEDAVAAEDYERAAKLRDRLRELEA